MPPPNRPKIPHRLLLCQSHGPCCRRNPNPNTLRLHRGPNSYDCPRTHVICTLLPGQHKLRTNTQPNNSSSPRPSNSATSHNNLMIHCQPRKPSTPPSTKSNGRAYNYHLPIQLILMIPSPNWRRHINYRRLFALHVFDDTTRPTSSTHHCPRPLPLSRTSINGPSPSPTPSANPEARTHLRLSCLSV